MVTEAGSTVLPVFPEQTLGANLVDMSTFGSPALDAAQGWS